MKKILISPEHYDAHEIETISELFTLGINVIHIRKPNFSESEMCKYIEQFPLKMQKKMVIHSHHNLINTYSLAGVHFRSTSTSKNACGNYTVSRSCHTYIEVKHHSDKHNYLFLSPVFNSISKTNYKSEFNQKDLISLNNKFCNIIALGGISSLNTNSLKALGFKGFSLYGSIWNKEKTKDRINEFKKILGTL